MDSELVSDSESKSGGGGDASSPTPFAYANMFKKAFPFYLALGMTPEQYWREDSTLVVSYREAHKLRKEMRNEELWLQGLYIYDALCCASPILRAFSTAKRPAPYPTKPYELTPRNEEEKRIRERKQYDKIKAKTEAFVEAFNNNFKKKRVNADE